MSVTNQPKIAELDRLLTIAAAVALSSLATVAGVVYQKSWLFSISQFVYDHLQAIPPGLEDAVATAIVWLFFSVTIGAALTYGLVVTDRLAGGTARQKVLAILTAVLVTRIVGGIVLAVVGFFALASIAPEASVVEALSLSVSYAGQLMSAGPSLRANLWVYGLLHVFGLVGGIPVARRLWPTEE